MSNARSSKTNDAPPAAAWRQTSDRIARRLLAVIARFEPEKVERLGIEACAGDVLRLPPDRWPRRIAAFDEERRRLAAELTAARHPELRFDLEIMIEQVEREIATLRLETAAVVPWVSVAETVFEGVRCLLAAPVGGGPAEPGRRRAALVRLRRYAGLEAGWPPLVRQAETFYRVHLDRRDLRWPFRGAVERDLAVAGRLSAGIPRLFERHRIAGHEAGCEALRRQLGAYYEGFVRRELLPLSRGDFRLPAEVYDDRLRRYGVDLPAAELASRARVAFLEIRGEMEAVARRLARRRGWTFSCVAGVVRELAKERLDGARILVCYRRRVAELEELVAREGLMTLPRRRPRVRLAGEAESATYPVPRFSYPPLAGDCGGAGELVLPALTRGHGALAADHLFDAAAWAVAAHEAVPGHAVQFAAMLEHGVPLARSALGFDLANIEGWAVYAESELRPHLPLEGQLISLQHRLLRAARAFLDPGLQQRRLTTRAAARILTAQVGISPAAARQEIARITHWLPGQATAYFCGYARVAELRSEVELALGRRFARREFHDLVLSQGLIPLPLLRRHVLEELVPRFESRQAA